MEATQALFILGIPITLQCFRVHLTAILGTIQHIRQSIPSISALQNVLENQPFELEELQSQVRIYIGFRAISARDWRPKELFEPLLSGSRPIRQWMNKWYPESYGSGRLPSMRESGTGDKKRTQEVDGYYMTT